MQNLIGPIVKNAEIFHKNIFIPFIHVVLGPKRLLGGLPHNNKGLYVIAIAVGLLFNIRYSKNSTMVVCCIHYCCLNKRIFYKISQNITQY